MALLVDYVGLARAANHTSQALSYGVALLFWVAFALNALQFEVHSGGGIASSSSQALALIGLLLAAATLLLLVVSAVEAIGSASEDAGVA